MDILPIGYFDDLRRCWRRKKYQKLDDATKIKRKLKIARLGRRNYLKEFNIKKVNISSGLKFFKPLGLVSKFHEAYVDAMIRLGSNKRIDQVKINEAKRVAKGQPIPMLSAATNEMVDSRIVMEMYKRVVSEPVLEI